MLAKDDRMTGWPIDNQQITRYLADMVAINSVNPSMSPDGPGEAEMAAWLLKICQGIGLETQQQEVLPGRPNVIARWRGTGGGKSVLLTGHTDVVQVNDMVIEPFVPRVENGLMYGRGALDMKSGLAAILGAVTALRAGGFEPAGDVILGFVIDEEFGSLGTKALIDVVKADHAILPEPSNLSIAIAHKGFAWITLTTHGRAAHGSLYERGIDAIAHMGRLLRELEIMEQEIFPRRVHPLLGRSSAHASLIEGGLGASTYPDTCTVKIEHRQLPDETPESMLALWQQAKARLSAAEPHFSATAALDLAQPSYELEPGSPLVKTVQAAYRRVLGSEPLVQGMFGWLDSALLGLAGIPTVIIGPGGEGAHAACEYVHLDKVFRCAAVIAEATTRLTIG
jgi:acetylornithine deacetylase